MSFNKITLVGHLGRDPELRYTPQGTAVCNFSMATSEKRKDKAGEWQYLTTWFRVTLWGKQGENAAKYLTKGSQVYIEGRLRIEEWQDRDGKERYTIEVNGSDMQFLGSAGGRSSSDEYSGGGDDDGPSHSGPANDSNDRPTISTPAADDDIPF